MPRCQLDSVTDVAVCQLDSCGPRSSFSIVFSSHAPCRRFVVCGIIRNMRVIESSVYSKWFRGLKDRVAKARIDRRIKRAARGDYGNVKPVGENVSELRLHFGPGYRIYFTERNGMLFVVLAGGTKNTQREDIALAKEIAKAL